MEQGLVLWISNHIRGLYVVVLNISRDCFPRPLFEMIGVFGFNNDWEVGGEAFY